MGAHSEVTSANINFRDPSKKQYQSIINEVIKLVAEETNKSEKEIKEFFNETYKEYSNNPGISFPLRSSVFRLIDLLPSEKIPVEIKLGEINEVYDNIRVYIRMFRRIRDIFTGKMIYPVVVFVPNPLLDNDSTFNSVTISAVGSAGELVFNINFIKKLVYIAELELKNKIVKIKSKIFKSNGGEIPDKYVYVAFLITHELFHLIQSDIKYLDKKLVEYICKNRKKYKIFKNVPGKDCEHNPFVLNIANQVQNIVADYFNNYNVYGLGFPALPIGLFSNEINLENMTYTQAYDKVLEKFNEMTKEQRLQIMNEQDEHIDINNNIRNKSKQRQKSSESPLRENQTSSGIGNLQNIPQRDVSDRLDEKREEIRKDVDETAIDTITKKISKDELEKIKEEMKNHEKIRKESLKRIADKIKKDLKSSQEEINYESVRPKYDWKTILKRMKPSEKKEEETYSRISRKSAARLLQAKQTGVALIRQGIKEEDVGKGSVLFILDKSGSMSDVFGIINTEMKKLMTKDMQKYFDEFYLIKFDSEFSFYQVDFQDNKIFEIPQIMTFIKKMKSKWNPQVFTKANKKPYPLIHFFDITNWDGGTIFSKEIYDIATLFLKNDKNNAVLITDKDILWKENKMKINSLIVKYGKKPFKFNIILRDRSAYITFIKNFRNFKYLTYFLENKK